MSVIGLYDIDLWHRGKSAPNLELMKIFNYYQSKNDIIRMMKPNEDEGRYTKIIYFKDNPNIQIPRHLMLNGDKKEKYGYGFYKKYTKLPELFQAIPPAYDPYDTYSYKLKVPVTSYDSLKKSSLIRLESNDFSDYKKDCLKMVFVDHDFLYQKNSYNCLLEFKNHRFFFYHPLWVRDPETFYQFERFSTLIDSFLIIDYKYDEDFFFNNFKNGKVLFKIEKRENETVENYRERNIKIGLFYKAEKIRFRLPFYPKEYEKIDSQIYEWIKSPSYESFEKYFGKVPKNISSNIRILLKQNPEKIGSSHLDFYKNL